MPEMHDTSEAERIKRLEADLAASQEALKLLKQERMGTRRRSHPSLSDMEIESAQESISNKLTKQIEQLKRERGELCYQVEAEEEFLVNSMQRQLDRVQKEKVQLENVLEQEQENLINRMRSLETPSSTEALPTGSPIKSNLTGTLAASSRCSSVLSSSNILDPTTNEYQNTITTLQNENFRLLAENIRLSQLLRRHNVYTGQSTPSSTAIPLRRCDSGLSDQSASRSGSISELRQFPSRTGFDSDDELSGIDLCANISPIRPQKS